MFINVDLPAPFSPSRACTSPRRRSKSMPSLATTPGKRFVIPRSSRTRGSSLIARILVPPTWRHRHVRRPAVAHRSWAPRGRGEPAPEDRFLLRQRLDLAAGDQLQELVRRVRELLPDGRRKLRAQPAVADPAVLGCVGVVESGLEARGVL